MSATVVKARAEERKKRSPGTWSNDVVHKHVEEVEDVDKGEALVVAQQSRHVLHHQDEVGDIRQYPAAPLFEELLETVWTVSGVVCESGVAKAPAVDHHQCGHPPVFTWPNTTIR